MFPFATGDEAWQDGGRDTCFVTRPLPSKQLRHLLPSLQTLEAEAIAGVQRETVRHFEVHIVTHISKVIWRGLSKGM